MQSKQAACNRAGQQATPEDMLVYFTQHWLPTHAGSMTADGELIAAPGSLSSTKPHLSSEFKLLGCIGDWNPASQTGNPMHSVQVRSLLKGYNNHAAELGYQRKGAVPLTDSEMLCLLQSMATTCSNSNTDQHQQLLLLRDGMLFSLLWQSCFRGFNAGALRLENILLPTGESAVPYLVPEVKLPAGAILHLLPDTTQNKRGGPGALQNHLVLRCSVLLLLAADGCALLCCSRPAYHRLHHQATSSGNQMLCRP